MSKKATSVLAAGASVDDKGSAQGVWWLDPERVLARAVMLAEADHSLLRLLRAKVGHLARRNNRFRLDLIEDLKEAGVAADGRPSDAPLNWQIFDSVNLWRASGMTQREACDLFASSQPWCQLSSEAVEARYKRHRRKQKTST